MWAKTERRWRKKAKRGVSPIIATILLVAITVVLAAVLYILISGLTKGPGNTPLGTAFAMSPAAESSKGVNFWYNFSVQAASGGLTWSNLAFQFQSSSGQIITVASPTITVIGLTGANVATYTAGTGAWTNGATTVSTTQELIVQTTTNMQSAGDVMISLGSGSFSGSVTTTIP